MMQLVFIAMGSAIGGVARYCLSSAINAVLGRDFPYGTLSVNILGSLLMGFLYVLMIERAHASIEWRGAIIVGLLGAFTTFSAFSLETVSLLEAGQRLSAIANMILSCILCVAGCWLGMAIAKNL